MAVPSWLGLLTLAAWLRTLEGVTAAVAADVIGSAAGVLFAATGAAAVFSRWQRRRLLRDVGDICAGDLNLLADSVLDLLRSLLTMLEPLIPLVRHASVEDLSTMVQPPCLPEASKLVLDVSLHGSSTLRDLIGGDASDVKIRRTHDDILEVLEAAQGGLATRDEKERLWVRAQIVAPALCWYDEDPGALQHFLDAAAGIWSQVPELAANIVNGTRDLSGLPVPGMRDLSFAVAQLEATVRSEWQMSTPKRLAGGEMHLRDAVQGCRRVLAETVYVSRQLTAVRAAFVRELDHDDVEEMMARHRIEHRDGTVAVARWFKEEEMAARLLSAWKTLNDPPIDNKQ